MSRPLRPAVLLLAAVLLAAPLGCRDDSPAFKKADLGRALAERGQTERAIAVLNEAIAMDPDIPMAHEALAGAYAAAGRYPEALDAYRATIARDPVRDSAYAGLGCLLLATGGDREEAEKMLGKALEINRAHSGAMACLGALHLDRRAFDDAIRETERAISLDPQNVQAHLTLGIALAETDQLERARAEIQKAIDGAAGNEAVVSQARMYLRSLDHPAVEGGPAAHP